MKRRFVLLAVPLLFTLLAGATPPRPARAPETPVPDSAIVVLTTELGTITIELDGRKAPITVRNFLRYVDQRRFDGTTFYRSMRLAWGEQPNGLVQAGTRGDPRRVLPPIAHEPTTATGIAHKAGTLSMARFAPGTATGDFSILLSDLPALDAQPAAAEPDAQAGFAAFGRVIAGMDVVRRIWASPLSPTAGQGALKGQMLEPPVRILSARRGTLPVPPAP